MKLGIIAYSSEITNGKLLIAESSGEIAESDDYTVLFNFILEELDEPGRKVIKVCWDVDEFAAPILKLLGRKVCEQLMGDTHRAYLRPYRVYYIRGKVFGVSYGRYTANIYSLSQYFDDVTDRPEDVVSVAAYGDALVDALDSMGMQPTKLASPAGIYEECVLRSLKIPTITDTPDGALEAADYALQCADRPWISAYQLGYWPKGECFDYDLRAAYPSVIKTLRNTRYCQYTKSARMLNADWGYLRGKVTMHVDPHPVLRRGDDGGLSNPLGSWYDYFTLDTVRFIEERGVGNFTLDDGWFLKFDNKATPLEVAVDRLYNYRGYNPLVDKLAKRMAAGIYGKFSEEHSDGSYGKLFNPFYAAQITSVTNNRVAAFIYDHGLTENLIAVSVDGCLTDRYVEVEDGGIGTWRLSGDGPAIVLSPGYIIYGGKKPHGINYDTLLNAVKQKPGASYYSIPLRRRQTLAESLGEGGFDDLGKDKVYQSGVDIALLETDRVFDKLPRTGHDLLTNRYTSRAVKINTEEEQ